MSLLTLVPSLVAAPLVFAGRTALVMSFGYWAAGYLATRVLIDRKPTALLTKGHIAALAVALGIFGAAGAVITAFRVVLDLQMTISERIMAYSDVLSWENVVGAWGSLNTSVFGGMASFSVYFAEAWRTPPTPEFGRYTLAGFLRWFNVPMSLPDYVVIDGVGTNAFVSFKPMISDYGLWGSLVAWFVYGLIAGWAYKKVRAGSLWPTAILVEFYTNSAVGGGMFFAYNSITAVFILTGCYMAWVANRQKRLDFSRMRIAMTQKHVSGAVGS